MVVRRIALALAMLTAITVGQSPVLANNQAQNVPDSTVLQEHLSGPFYQIDEELLDPVTAQLLWQLSHKPELMTPDYLNYFLGKPETRTSQIGIRSHAYYWYDKMRHLRCELYQEEDKPGEIVESIMHFHLPATDFDFAEVKDTLGPAQRKYFDQTGFPTQMYSYVPNTALAFATAPDAFSITKATVTYLGPPLPRPSFEDIQLAHDTWIAKNQLPTSESQLAKLDWRERLALAREQVQEHPSDATAHAGLAEALKRTGNVHEAIGEYKLTLSLGKYNQVVRAQCIQGLKDLYVLPQDYGTDADTQVAGKQPLKITHSGHRMRTAGKATTQVAGTGNGSN